MARDQSRKQKLPEQVAVIALRRTDDLVHMCLIRRKGSRKWGIPKGFVDASDTPEEAALNEACEEAGLTGHLVISTIHSGVGAGVYARMINMNIEPFLLASSIIAVLSIRLIRVNCSFCTKPYQPETAMLRLMPDELVANTEFRKGTGCEQCLHTGFAGRTALTELLVADEVFRDAVLQKLPTRALQDVAIRQGMQTMWQNGIKRVVAGQTTIDEVMRVVSAEQL